MQLFRQFFLLSINIMEGFHCSHSKNSLLQSLSYYSRTLRTLAHISFLKFPTNNMRPSVGTYRLLLSSKKELLINSCVWKRDLKSHRPHVSRSSITPLRPMQLFDKACNPSYMHPITTTKKTAFYNDTFPTAKRLFAKSNHFLLVFSRWLKRGKC